MGNTKVWEPTVAEMQLAQTLVLADTFPDRVDAVVVHGSPVDDEMVGRNQLEVVAARYHRGEVGKVVLNGLMEPGHVPARGIWNHSYTVSHQQLLDLGVPAEAIEFTDPCHHTAAEVKAFLALAEERGWNKLGVAAVSFHQLRCCLQWVALLPFRHTFFSDGIRIWNLPSRGISTRLEMRKVVLTPGAEPVFGTIEEHTAAELERVIAYAQEPPLVDGHPKYTRHATIPELVKYLWSRDGQSAE